MSRPAVLRVGIPLSGMPRLVVAGRFPLGDKGFPVDYNAPDTHALHLHGYSGRFRLAGREHSLRPGDLTLTPARTPNRYDLDAPGYCWCVHFHFARNTDKSLTLPTHVSLGVDSMEAERRLTEVAHLHACAMDARDGSGGGRRAREASTWSMRARLCFQDLLLWLAQQSNRPAGRSSSSSSSRADRAVEQAATILATRLVDPPSVPALAEELELSQNYLARLFRRRFGVTLVQYSLRRRIEYARHLLLSTDLPASKVGARVGMSDPRHFSKRFRSVTGLTPAAVR